MESPREPLIDIGANLTNAAFRDHLPGVIARAREAGLAAIVVTGTSVEVSEAATRLASDHPAFLYATAGVHPHHARDWSESSRQALAQLLRSENVVAAGECGLDFERNYSPPAAQVNCFRQQLELACELGKPLFLHCRGAHRQFIEVLDGCSRLPRLVVHCFTEGPEQVRAYIARGWYIGITGWICDERRGAALREAVREIPLQRLLVETDAPYLIPLNKPDARRRDRNEPAYLPWTVKKLAECRSQIEPWIAHATTCAAMEIFGLGGKTQGAQIYNYRMVTHRLATSGQPTEAQLAAMAREGFGAVINLALHNDPRYSLPDETGLVRSLGMEYVHIPVQFDRPTQADLSAFFAAMELHKEQKVLVHCAANMRVSAFVGLYRAIRERLPDEEAFSVMKTIWEPNPVWAAFIAAMLEAQRK
jgi:TatD DNase family protein